MFYMYGQHFGFSRPLFFDGMAQDDDVFRTAAINRLVRDLEVALTRRDAVAVISGNSGTGKSTIATDSLKNIDTQLAFTSINQPPITQNELLEQLLTDFDFEPHDKSRVERLQLWRQFLTEMGATNTRVSILIEKLEDWAPEVLQTLHNLTVADADLSPGANLVFTTCAATDNFLISPDLIALSQRVRLRRRIEPLTTEETQEYIAFKCEQAGASASEIFSADFAACLNKYSGGSIRVIDNLIESSLMSAAADNKARVTVEILKQVAVNQFGMAELAVPSVEDMLLETTPGRDTGSEMGTDTGTDEIPTLTEVVLLDEEFDSKETLSGVTA
jgi:type II secretory pathway predicted ATPase ExeA